MDQLHDWRNSTNDRSNYVRNIHYTRNSALTRV